MEAGAGSPPAASEPDRTDVLGRRVAAGFLDLIVLLVVFVVMGLLIGDSQSGDGGASVNLEGWDAVLFFVLVLLYYGIQEGANGNTTLGKRALGLRVEADNGEAPTGGQVTGRTLLRIIDGLPLFYLLGFITVLATGKRQKRLGDLAAGTRVVRAPASS
jgi:uncharacterized RDD family membrane protein YckC